MKEKHTRKQPKTGQVIPDQKNSSPIHYELEQEIREDRNMNTEKLTDTSDAQRPSEEPGDATDKDSL